jgi:hypothetical protein
MRREYSNYERAERPRKLDEEQPAASTVRISFRSTSGDVVDTEHLGRHCCIGESLQAAGWADASSLYPAPVVARSAPLGRVCRCLRAIPATTHRKGSYDVAINSNARTGSSLSSTTISRAQSTSPGRKRGRNIAASLVGVQCGLDPMMVLGCGESRADAWWRHVHADDAPSGTLSCPGEHAKSPE